MHASAMRHGAKFFNDYLPKIKHPSQGRPMIVEVGSMIVAGGSLREAAPAGWGYVGVDCEHGPGVDVKLSDPYSLPFQNNQVEAVVSSSAFEHVEFFWLTFLEMARIAKPGGFIYVNAPSNGPFHEYPVDCWRFYPDAGWALENWAKRYGYDVKLVDTYIGEPDEDVAHWEDWVGIWRKE